ncbi:MAG TPA: prepilin peptidase [Planctomycetaceae bacterium]|nr:prepilin peptidase [Planctomycetaceae bacterium]
MTPFDAPLWIVLAYLFIVGAVLGSFLNVCIHRIPWHERFVDQLRSLGSPLHSVCPGCGSRIPRRDNVPILGWLMLRGRCRFCRMRISPRYPLVELLNGLLFVLVYWVEVPGGYSATVQDSGTFAALGPQITGGLSPAAWLNWRYVYHMVLFEALVVATFIDFEHMTIPDGCTLPAMAVGVIGGFALGQVFLVPVWFQEPEIARMLSAWTPDWLNRASGPMVVPQVEWREDFMGRVARLEIPDWVRTAPHRHGLAVSLAGLVIGGGVVWALRIVGQLVLKREAMGFGDVVLMATIGSFLGWQPTLTVFFVAPVCALGVLAVQQIGWRLACIIRPMLRRDAVSRSGADGGRREIPYGPYLSLAALLTVLGWKHIWPVAQWWFAFGPIVLVAFVAFPVAMFASLTLFQAARRLLGIPLTDEPRDTLVIEEWTPADQLIYLQGENVDRLRGRWKPQHDWPGTAAARGTSQVERWKNGP